MEIDHHSTTCTITLQEIKPFFSSHIIVNLNFQNYNTTTLGHSYSNDRNCNISPITLTFELESENSINFNVLTAESNQPLPDYVTPGVWSDVKESVLSFILNQDYWLGFEMVVAVDVATMVTIVYNFDQVIESKLPRYIIGCESDYETDDEDEDDYNSDDEEDLLNGVNGSKWWLITTMVMIEKSGANVWMVLLMALWYIIMFGMALHNFIKNI